MKKTIYDYSEENRAQAEKKYIKAMTEHPEEFKKAKELIDVLGLGGFWNGYISAVVAVLEYNNVI
jgi:hypothetical protein